MAQTKSKSYWIKREKAKERKAAKNSLKPLSQLRSENIALKNEIVDDIAAFYKKFADRNDIALAEAKKLLNKTELKGFYSKLKKWKEQVKASDNPLLSKKIDAMLTRSKIQRLEQLITTVQVRIDEFSRYEQTTIYDHMMTTSKMSYDDLALAVRNAGITTNMGFMPDNAINQMLNFPLSGQSFSKDIWDNRDKMANDLQKIITRGINQGNSYSTMAKELGDKVGGNYVHLKRIVRTETKHAVEQGNKSGYNKIGVDKYEIVSINDERSSDDYDLYNGDVYKVEDAMPGINFPPFHPNCRCVTIPYFGD